MKFERKTVFFLDLPILEYNNNFFKNLEKTDYLHQPFSDHPTLNKTKQHYIEYFLLLNYIKWLHFHRWRNHIYFPSIRIIMIYPKIHFKTKQKLISKQIIVQPSTLVFLVSFFVLNAEFIVNVCYTQNYKIFIFYISKYCN